MIRRLACELLSGRRRIASRAADNESARARVLPAKGMAADTMDPAVINTANFRKFGRLRKRPWGNFVPGQ